MWDNHLSLGLCIIIQGVSITYIVSALAMPSATAVKSESQIWSSHYISDVYRKQHAKVKKHPIKGKLLQFCFICIESAKESHYST